MQDTASLTDGKSPASHISDITVIRSRDPKVQQVSEICLSLHAAAWTISFARFHAQKYTTRLLSVQATEPLQFVRIAVKLLHTRTYRICIQDNMRTSDGPSTSVHCPLSVRYAITGLVIQNEIGNIKGGREAKERDQNGPS